MAKYNEVSQLETGERLGLNNNFKQVGQVQAKTCYHRNEQLNIFFDQKNRVRAMSVTINFFQKIALYDIM